MWTDWDDSTNPNVLTMNPLLVRDEYEILVSLTFYEKDGTCATPYFDVDGLTADTSFTIYPRVPCDIYPWLVLEDT
jgi:hypothetical protein